MGRTIVGYHVFGADSVLEIEPAHRGLPRRGTRFEFFRDGSVQFIQRFVDDLPHGYARQWTHDGRLIGSFRMIRGTGTDLWWHACSRGREHYLAEAFQSRHGWRYGFDWWLNEDGTLSIESHWKANKPHGVTRVWDECGHLADGYPEFFINGKKVDRATYEAAARRQKSLPKLRAIDDKPQRRFPPNIARVLRVTPK
ncbi:MAG: toxin-antitoxin system YwqK family antitoxin [Phycisphaerae bacterium]